MTIEELASAWIEAKQAEQAAVENRRRIEDDLVATLGIDEMLDGTKTTEIENGFQIKVVGRLNRKVDPDRLQEIAAECGLSHHLSSLFRWKPELNLTAWKAADAHVVKPLSGAITTSPGRPSFTISKKD
jgi:hypothetical protein